ncbi:MULTISPECIES: shikimate kinase [unclassified Paenibacillus]|uniref:shikimate kinase n=1 Tax=unclassified Paenibacillus TaxID=185978 RepID=UPI001AE2B414|nr:MULTISPECIES: shikimate kinase [unclassified Paenibacillus]MBP1156148.1 shikimate kinase [Paenibacillus sp. PvP091]MBP1168466.1 shikimate kinase [Paenibacillus sp. PvR098]MBP2439494.1 shikimate kinase [Paenibacillus sp. PvP052]
MGKNRNIVLIGMMGSGKTTVGQALSAKLGWTYIDTDSEIVRSQGMSISEMFAKQGEEAFRRAESDTIGDVLRGSKQVIATGGGAVLLEQNRHAMNENGFVVALSASVETIIERVRGDQNRPLLQGNLEERVNHIVVSRKHAYDFADLKVDTDGLPVDRIIDVICSAMGNA